MGRKSKLKMTGLSQEGRIQRSKDRKAEEERIRREHEAQLLEALIEAAKKRTEVVLPPMPLPKGVKLIQAQQKKVLKDIERKHEKAKEE